MCVCVLAYVDVYSYYMDVKACGYLWAYLCAHECTREHVGVLDVWVHVIVCVGVCKST